MKMKHILVPFVMGVAFLAGAALAQTYVVGDRFLVNNNNPFVYDQVNDIWLYPWTWDDDLKDAACTDTGRVLEELGG